MDNIEKGSVNGSASSDFLAALRDFKRESATATDYDNPENERATEIGDQICTVCGSHPLISSSEGYYIECTDTHCSNMEQMTVYSNKMLHNFRELGASGNISTRIPQEEIYESYFYGSKHWSYCASEDNLGPVILTLKQEFRQTRDFLRIMVRSSTHIIHGMLPVSSVCSSPYSSHKEVVEFLAKEIGLTAPLKLINLSSAPGELLRIDKVYLKDEYKIGLLYVKEGQETEEEMFENQEHSPAFDDFLDCLGDRVQLQGFTKYRGGLDNVNNLTGLQSVHATYKNKQVMFHVSTMLPFDKNDTQKLQRKRHIGNDIACVVFLEASSTKFNPNCIKSNFLHTFVVVQVDVSRNPHKYNVSVVSKNRVPLYEPRLTEQHTFDKGPEFRNWVLRKVINGETACHKAPDFAKLHQRTRQLLMDELIKSVEKREESSQEKREPQPFRDIGRRRSQTVARPGSPFQDGLQQRVNSVEQLAKDFTTAFTGKDKKLADVVFIAGKKKKERFVGVQAIMAARSSVFYKLLLDEPTTPKSPEISPNSGRKVSWSGTSILPGGSKSKKFVLNRLKRSQSTNDADRNDVVLSSVTELERLGENGVLDAKDAPPLRQFVVEDFEADVFEALMRYLHTGSCHITATILPGLLCAAEHYDVTELRQACLDSIDECVDTTTIYSLLMSLDDYSGHSSAQLLRRKIGTFIEQADITDIDLKEFLTLSTESARLVLSSVKQVEEISKFEAIVEWAKSTSRKMDCRVSIEELARPLLRNYIDIDKISPSDLIQVVQPSGLVSNDDVMAALASKAQSHDSAM